MNIYTSYFGNIRHLPQKMVLFSIAGKTPDWFYGSKCPFNIRFGKLAPKYEWWKEWKDKFGSNPESDESVAWYSEKYFGTVLNPLNPKEIYNEIEFMSLGKDACLLCYETPDKFCHRKLVAKWFNNNGIDVREYGS